MSGIVGIVRHEAPVDRDLLAALSRSLEFRGPHGTDMWLEGAAGLGHALLEPVWSVSRNGIIHGFCLWFDSELAPGLSLSNAPGQPETIYGRIFVPLEEPVAVEAGCEIAARIRADLLAGEYVWRWDTSVNGERRFSQSTFYGMPVVPPHLHRAPARGIK
jgi:hypothetical protein